MDASNNILLHTAAIIAMIFLSYQVRQITCNDAFEVAKELQKEKYAFSMKDHKFVGTVDRVPEDLKYQDGTEKAKVFFTLTAIDAVRHEYAKSGIKNGVGFVTIQKLYRTPVVEIVRARGSAGYSGDGITKDDKYSKEYEAFNAAFDAVVKQTYKKWLETHTTTSDV